MWVYIRLFIWIYPVAQHEALKVRNLTCIARKCESRSQVKVAFDEMIKDFLESTFSARLQVASRLNSLKTGMAAAKLVWKRVTSVKIWRKSLKFKRDM